MYTLFMDYGGWWVIALFPFIFGVILSVIGLFLLITSMKKISVAKANKLVSIIGDIILLVIGLILIIYSGYTMYVRGIDWFGLQPLIIGVVVFVIGFLLLIPSMKKNSKSPDKSIT